MHEVVDDNSNCYRSMVMNALRMNQGYTCECSIVDKELNADTTMIFKLLKDSHEPLWDGCTNHSKLLVVTQMFTIKSDHGLSVASYEKIIKWVTSILPKENRLKENIYVAKSMIKSFGLGYKKIDIWSNFCILYYLENTDLTECKTYGHARYKPKTGRGKTFFVYKKLKYFSITPKL